MRSNFESLSAFVAEIERREAAKSDIVAPSSAITMSGDDHLEISGDGAVISGVLTQYAHGQVASKLHIPKDYYDRMTAVPGLRSYNVNQWLHNSDARHLVRFQDDKARALLSDKFFPVDHQAVMEGAVLRAFDRLDLRGDKIEVASQSLSDTRMYLQVRFPRLTRDVRPGDPVQLGLTVTNSEVGAGAVDVALMVWRLVCSNGAIGESIVRRHHVGQRLGNDLVDISEYYRRETVVAELRSFRMRLEDGVVATLTEAVLDREVEKLRSAAGDKIERPDLSVRNVTSHLSLSQTDYDAIMQDMGHDGEYTRYTMYNAITARAHATEDPDAGYQYEKAGQQLIEMPRSQWSSLMERAA